MANVKVSELPVATVVDNAAIFVCNVSGVTSSATREDLLTSNGAEKIEMQGFAGATVYIESNGGIYLSAENSQGIGLESAGTNASLYLLGNGDVDFNSTGPNGLRIDCNGAALIMNGGGSVSLAALTGGTTDVAYLMGNPAHWVSDPTWHRIAIDRIVAWIFANNGGVPI